MTGIVLLLLAAAVTFLIIRRRGRVFLEREEGLSLGLTLVLCLVQKILVQYVSLSDVFVTPFYLALVICIGHARGPAQGAVSGFFSALVITFCSLAFTIFEMSETGSAAFPLQYVFVIVVWMLIGGTAGMKEIPKAFKPFLVLLWLLFVAAYSPPFLRNLNAYIILFGAICLSSVGLYFNLFRRKSVSTVFYPTSPSRRSGE
jgi:hypothetical protein